MEKINSACTYLVSLGKTHEQIRASEESVQRAEREIWLKRPDVNACHIQGCRSMEGSSKIPIRVSAGGAIPYDERILSFKGLDRVSISTLKGRLKLRLRVGEYQRERL
jgi:hypothetical protein